MRHRQRKHKLGRTSSHRKAMLRNLASSLILTEREALDIDENAPKVKGRVVTTVSKAKAVRPLVEKCITIARKSLPHQDKASEFASDADRDSEAWKEWRQSEQWLQWNNAIAPALAARRRAIQLLGDKEAVQVLFDELAPRFADRNGGYTRILQLATPRLGDAGPRAILEFVGVHDRATEKSEKPEFGDPGEQDDEESSLKDQPEDQQSNDQTSSESADSETAAAEDGAGDQPAADEEKVE